MIPEKLSFFSRVILVKRSIKYDYIKILIDLYFFVWFWFFFLSTQHGMWDPSYWTMAQTHACCIGRQSLNHCTTREVPLTDHFRWIGRKKIFTTFSERIPMFLGSILMLIHDSSSQIR